MDYAEYLNSTEWRLRARAAKQLSDGCALCMATTSLEVHHRTYARVGRELLTDLVVLCSRCHRRHHGTFDDCVNQQLTLPLLPHGADFN